MTGIVLALGWATAFFLLYDWWTRPEAAPARSWKLPLQAAVEERLRQAGVHDVAPWQVLGVSLLLALLGALLAQLWLGFVALSLPAAVVAGLLPTAYLRARARRRRAALEEALVEALHQLRDSVRSGLGLAEACDGLSRTGPPLLRPDFALLVRQAAYAGWPRALRAWQGRLASPLGDLVVSSLLISEQLGSRNLSSVLDRLARATREQRRIRREAEAAQAGQVLAVSIAAAIPALVFLAIRRANPGYLAFFGTPTGELVLGGCAVLLAAAYAAMLHLGRLPEEPRVLRPEEEGDTGC
jgi:tight adherence protein B